MKKILALLLAYAIAPVAVGHGVAPMLVFLLPLRPPTTGQVLGWSAIVLFACVLKWTRANTPVRILLSLAGAAVLYLSWLSIVRQIAPMNEPAEQQGAFESMLMLSAPLQLVFVVVVVMLALQLKRVLSAQRPAS